MARYRKNAKHPVIVHGLYAHVEKWKLDGRTKLAQTMNKAREALQQLFPEGAINAPAAILIDRAIYKALKLSIYESMDLKGEPLPPGSAQSYLGIANSLRADIESLWRMARDAGPIERVPSLQEYLAAMKSGKLQVVGDDKDSD